MFNLMKETVQYIVATLIHNAPILFLGILVAAAIKVYLDPEQMRQKLMSKASTSIGASVLFGTFTPFCACGTMAVIVAMMTTALPWAPVMAFLTSSPLMSPDVFILYSGIVSVKFAMALAGSSIVIGFASGYVTYLIEKKSHFLKGQARFNNSKMSQLPPQNTHVGCCNTSQAELKIISATPSKASSVSTCGCESGTSILPRVKSSFLQKYKLKELFSVFYNIGIRQVLVYFTVFAGIGFLINQLVPATLIMKYIGAGNSFAVPLMALIGLPLYVSGSSAIPIVNALLTGGASHGALLAFMITGPGTSAGVIAGLVTIMRKKAIALYVMYLIVFAIALGYLYDYLLLLGV